MNIQEEYQTSPNTSGTAPRNNNTPAVLIDVKKCAYCDMHTPRDSLSPRTRADLLKSGLAEHELTSDEALKRAQKIRMKRTRKLLAERRNAPPVISVPCIPKERLDEIRRRVFSYKIAPAVENSSSNEEQQAANQEFMERVMQYWLLKRYARNGRPLLRRLQMSATVKKSSGGSGSSGTNQAANTSSSPLSSPTSPNPVVTKEKPKEETTPNSKKEYCLVLTLFIKREQKERKIIFNCYFLFD